MTENSIKAKRVLRFFISSVGKMMGEERETLRDIIWKQGHLPLAMEGFWGSHAQTSLDVVIDNLKKADVVVIVLGYNYGAVIGKGMKCSNCPIYESCTGKKGKRQRECTISYTHFEYLYAKQEKIKSYCVIQKDIGKVDGIQSRLNKLGYDKKDADIIVDGYLNKRDAQLSFVEVAQGNWATFYDSNDPEKGIPERFKEIFAEIIADISHGSDDLYGLVDGREMLEELRKRNEKIEELRKNLDETHAFYRHQISNLSNPTTAVTGTCIPFEYKKESDSIITYLILNSAYVNGNRLMFPGGHAFVNDESPEDIAIAKARIEAGLVVRPIDLYQNFDMLPQGRTISTKDSHYSPEFCVYKPPHYSYLFTQNENAKCYKNDNHHFHYDAVYVCEITEILKEEQCAQRRVKIELPNTMPTMVSTKRFLELNIDKTRFLNDSYGEYIIKMLYEAYKDYVIYINNVLKVGKEL